MNPDQAQSIDTIYCIYCENENLVFSQISPERDWCSLWLEMDLFINYNYDQQMSEYARLNQRIDEGEGTAKSEKRRRVVYFYCRFSELFLVQPFSLSCSLSTLRLSSFLLFILSLNGKLATKYMFSANLHVNKTSCVAIFHSQYLSRANNCSGFATVGHRISHGTVRNRLTNVFRAHNFR